VQVRKLKQWLKTRQLDAIWLLVAGLAGLAGGLWARDIILDDAMITFRVAENLAYGRGFVYNVGERVQVTTTPLYAMVLAVGTWLAGSAPRAALLLNIALAAFISILAYNTGRRLAGRITGLGGALLLALMPLLVIAFSMESYLYVALILASLNSYLARHTRLAGVLAGLTALARGDAVLVGASLLTYDFLVHRRLHWRLIIPAVTLPAGWYLFATVYYGWPFPATLAAKTAQGQFNWLGDYFISGFLRYWQSWLAEYSPLFYLFPALILLGLARALLTDRRWLLLLGHSALYIATFVGLGVTFAEWYYAPLTPAVALFTASGIQFLSEETANLATRKIRWGQPQPRFIASGLAGALVATLLATLYPVTADIVAANPDWKAQAYPPVARWIAKHTNHSANLATIDIGHLGYWSNRQIIDIVGLAQPDVAPHIANGDFGYAIRQYRPDMVVIGATWLPEVQSKDWFQGQYTPRHILRPDGLMEPIVLFTRPQGVKVQSEPIPASEITALKVDFNRQILLTGYYADQPATPGSALNLTLFWQATAPIEVDYTVFVQLVDSGNNILAQGDSKPQQGFYPTPYWQPGERVIDTYTLPLDGKLLPGGYDILLGFYEAETGRRLQVLDEAGRFKRDHVRLTGIQVDAP